ncbi:hypothetical protein AWR36_004205 [Microbulbifer flavimaris]|uniref:Uncharacterized protein n=2 Tax=Microbulbiferaceae TaxID=1706373 RepID=A0ABX4I3E6_9GAMM|nr:hypothetical protein AVO43_04205 [Microbulbifer sp. ZGT114]PCO06945.1 hypothetical protein AWR36_004205 [Microbulbifer flavimaris]
MDNRGGDGRNERRNDHRNPRRDERTVKLADTPTGSRGPRVIPVSERPAHDRRTVRDRPKPQTQRGQPQRQRKAPNDRRNTAAKPAPRQEREQLKNRQPKKKEKKSKKKKDKRDQVRRVREPLNRRSNEARRKID